MYKTPTLPTLASPSPSALSPSYPHPVCVNNVSYGICPLRSCTALYKISLIKYYIPFILYYIILYLYTVTTTRNVFVVVVVVGEGGVVGVSDHVLSFAYI